MMSIKEMNLYLAVAFLFLVTSSSSAVDNVNIYVFDGFMVSQYDHVKGKWSQPIDIKNNVVPEYMNMNSIYRSNFITARIQGPKNSYKKGVTVSIVALKGGIEFKRQYYESLYFGKDGFYFTPILIHELFCEPIDIIFELRDNNLLEKHKIVINYACGE